MTASSTFVDRDRGWNSFQRLVVDMNSKVVVVGVIHGQIATYATANEFGVPSRNIPARPAFRTMVDKNRDMLGRELNRQMQRQIARRSPSSDGAYISVGLLASNLLKKSIRNWSIPPNAPSTILQKGVNNPLADTGAEQQAVTFEVRSRGAVGS